MHGAMFPTCACINEISSTTVLTVLQIFRPFDACSSTPSAILIHPKLYPCSAYPYRVNLAWLMKQKPPSHTVRQCKLRKAAVSIVEDSEAEESTMAPLQVGGHISLTTRMRSLV